jgi:putative hydrolase
MSVPFGFGLPDDTGDGRDGPGGQGGAFDLGSLGAALQQLGAMMQAGANAPDAGGPVNWSMVSDVARKTLAQAGDPSVSDAQRRAVDDAVRLADVWLDPVVSFPATGLPAAAWSRSEWFEATGGAWQTIVRPIAQHMQEVVGQSVAGVSGTEIDPAALAEQLPEELRAMLPGGVPPELAQMMGPMLQMMQQLGVVAFSAQLGQGLAALAGEVVSSSDIGIPLTDNAQPALLPRNVEEYGAGLGLPADDVRLYLALRESAHQRLVAHVPWLRGRVHGAIEEYARGLRVDPDRMRDAMSGIDVSNPQALQELMANGLLQPEDTPEQRAALARLETLLALVEGWVDDVVDQAVDGRLPSAASLRETTRRRRAAGGPAEKTFANLVGMELRPRLAREAATLFAVVRAGRGAQARDALWGHPDLLPGPDDLADPLGFVEDSATELQFDLPDTPPAAEGDPTDQ